MKQTTIKKRVQSVGIGLHKGEPIEMTIEPLEANEGIVFYRKDKNLTLKANPSNVVDTQMATTIGNPNNLQTKKQTISTIEHFLSAVYSYGIDNLRIILDGDEVPVMDGSAASFCMMLDEAGIRHLDAQKNIMIIKKTIEVREEDKFVRITPSQKPTFRFTINFDHIAIGTQKYSFNFSKSGFIKDIAKARTFGFLRDVQRLRSMGLGLGGSLDNAIVLDEKKILNPEGLRFDDEFVRHKILDALGDLSLLGMPIIGDYESYAGSHRLNHFLTKKILSCAENYEIRHIDKEIASVYEKVLA